MKKSDPGRHHSRPGIGERVTPIPGNVLAIVAEYLRANGFSGLAAEECGCEIGDLAPCCIGENFMNCQPGYKVPCLGGEDCPAYGDCEWHISTEKPEAPDDT